MNLSKVFDATSPGFLYSFLVASLSIFAIAGVQFPADPATISADTVNLFSTGGFFALIGVAVSSIIFPIYNAAKKGNLSFKGVFSNSLTWVALVVLVFDAVALTGLILPAGTAQNLVTYIYAKDWSSLIGMVVTVIVPTVVRWVQNRKKTAAKA